MTNPNEVELPGASVPFHAALSKIRCWPEPERTESQVLDGEEPAGRSKITRQWVMSAGPSFVIVYCA